MQWRAGNLERSPIATAFTDNVRAHFGEGSNHPTHWPTAQRLITIETRGKRARREQPGEQPHRRAGVATVDSLPWSVQSAPATAFDMDFGARLRDVHTKGTERANRAAIIATAGAIADIALALGDSGEHDGAMANRLIAREGDRALHAGGGGTDSDERVRIHNEEGAAYSMGRGVCVQERHRLLPSLR